MDWLCKLEFWTTFFTLLSLEIVLGIDNIIFHALTISSLPYQHQRKARILGMSLALLFRFLLLWSFVWLMSLTKVTIPVGNMSISARELVLIGGGAFLVIKSAMELWKPSSQSPAGAKTPRAQRNSIIACIFQIIVLDIIFSLDSVITAVAIATDMRAIMMAICVAILIMMFCSAAVSRFLDIHTRIKGLAFMFIAAIGILLVSEGFGLIIPKGYAYGLAGIALAYELVRIRLRIGEQIKVAKVRRQQSPSIDFAASGEPGRLSQAFLTELHCDNPNPKCSQCDTHKNGYWFCLLCGNGLGDVPFNLGEVAYTNYAS